MLRLSTQLRLRLFGLVAVFFCLAASILWKGETMRAEKDVAELLRINYRDVSTGFTDRADFQLARTARDLAARGAGTFVYTDTATDGMLSGPNLAAMAAMCDAVPGLPVVASGGISTADGVRSLTALARPNLDGVIVGRALYEGTATLPDLLAACSMDASAS